MRIPNFTTPFWQKCLRWFKLFMSISNFLMWNKISPRLFGAKFFTVMVLAIAIAGCKKESELGEDLMPPNEALDVRTTDTLTLVAYSVAEDSLRTDETPIAVLGHYQDPVFGYTAASMFTQFHIANAALNINFGAGAVLDSTVLTLGYNFDFYGDTTVSQTLSVYQMTESIYKDSVYYSHQTKSYYPSPVGSVTFAPRPRTKVVLGQDTVPAHLRIKLDPTFGQIIFSQSGGTNLSSNANWINFMKGLYIAPSGSPGGGLIYINPKDTLTRLTLFYHTPTDTTKFSFVVNNTTPYYSYYKHNFQNASPDLQSQMNNNTTSDYVYVQSLAGVKTKIEFPFLENWKNLGYKVAINKAELIIKADPSFSTDNLPLNKQLYVTSVDSAGKQSLTLDFFESSAYYGGSLNTTANEYKINLARHFQSVINGNTDNYGIFLKEIFPSESGRRGVLGSPTSPTYKMHIRLVYTVIN